MKNMNTKELYNLYNNNPYIKIIDVRSPIEYALGHIKNSFNIPLETLTTKYLLYLNSEFTYYIICKSGERSKEACKKLEKQKYKVINIYNGIIAWPGKLEKDRQFN